MRSTSMQLERYSCKPVLRKGVSNFLPCCCGGILLFLALLSPVVVAAAEAVVPVEEDGLDETAMPAMLDRDDISYFFDLGLEDLYEVLHFLFEQSARLPSPGGGGEDGEEEEQVTLSEVPDRLLNRGSGTSFTTRAKLQHDLEQALYLSSILRDETESKFFRDIAVPLYQSVLKNLDSKAAADTDKKNKVQYGEDDDDNLNLYFFEREDYELAIDLVYNKAWRPTLMDPVMDETTGAFEPMLNPQLNRKQIQRDWKSSNQTLLVMDNFLSETALAKIDQILTQSTVWFESNPQKGGHVTGAYLDDGLYDKLLLQLCYEIHQTLLSPMNNDEKGQTSLSLHDMWARKYFDEDDNLLESDNNSDNKYFQPIIMEMGDAYASMRLHLWLSNPPPVVVGGGAVDAEDDSVGTGELVVFTVEPPSDWMTSMGPTGQEVLDTLIAPSGFLNITVPFQRNRAVLFNAHLFHQQSGFHPPLSKKPIPYQHRRTDLTFLFGPSTGSGSYSEENGHGNDVDQDL